MCVRSIDIEQLCICVLGVYRYLAVMYMCVWNIDIEQSCICVLEV